MLAYEELKQKLVIDLHNLPVCCSEQPTLFLEASEEASKAKASAKVEKLNLEKLIATVDLKIRQNKEEKKLTESAITSMINTDKSVGEQKELLIQLETEAIKWDSLVEAFNQRRSMLSNEVSLYTYNYFNTSDVSEMDEFEKAIIEKRKQNAEKEKTRHPR